MATSITFNGVSYSVPEVGEESWGESLSNYYIAISTGALQKTGGTFLLTADVNFGSNYGLLSKYFSTRTANPAATGNFRLAVTDTIGWRNNANGGNLLLAVNASDQLTFNGTAIYPAGITALTGDVTATGPGSVAATVVQVGGYSAANVAAGATLANAAATGNTASTIVKRDASGNFLAGTISAALTGVASGNTTITPSQYGVVVSGAANVLSVVTPDASTIKVLTSGGTGAIPTWQFVTTDINLATFGSTPNASGGSISNGVITLQPADGTNPGGLTAGAQSVGGVKTFASAPVLSALTASQVVVTDSGKALTSVAYATGNTVSALVQRDSVGNFVAATGTFSSLAVTGLTASQAVVTNSSKNLASLSYVSIPTASTLMSRDSSANVQSNNHTDNYATTATAAATTTLTVASAKNQFFTGATTQIVQLPDATTLSQTGFQFYIVNLSSGAVTIKDAGSNTVQALAAASFAFVTAKSIASSNGSWDVQYSTNNAGGGTVTSVGLTVPNIFSATGTPVTTSGSLGITLATQSPATYFSGPQIAATGAAAAPTFKSFRAPTQQIFTSGTAQTYTTPVGCLQIKITCVGGGAAGGGSGGGANSGGAGGGGAGGTAIKWVNSPAATYLYSVGAAATATSFGASLCAANGGTAGSNGTAGSGGVAGGAGGAGTAGDIQRPGGAGLTGENTIATVLYGAGGAGGASVGQYGGAGGAGAVSNAAGIAGGNYGGGGQGGSGSAGGAGAGAGGIIVVEEIYQ